MSIEYRNKIDNCWIFWTSEQYKKNNSRKDFLRKIFDLLHSSDLLESTKYFTMPKYTFGINKKVIKTDWVKYPIEDIFAIQSEVDHNLYVSYHINAFLGSGKSILFENAFLATIEFREQQYLLSIGITDCLLPLRTTNPNFSSVSNWNTYQMNKFRLRNLLLDINNLGIWEEDYSTNTSTDLSTEGHFTTGTDLIMRYRRIKDYIAGLDEDDIDPNVSIEEYRKDYPCEFYGESEESF